MAISGLLLDGSPGAYRAIRDLEQQRKTKEEDLRPLFQSYK